MFFLNEDTAERAREVFHTLVEVEYEALGGPINNDAQEDHDTEAGDEGSMSILQSLRKRICRDRDRERQIQVKFFVELKLKHTFLNFNILGFGSTLRKRQKQMRKL